MTESLYFIQVAMPEIAYVVVDGDVSIVKDKASATLFKSRMLAYGWLAKAKHRYIRYKFAVITL